MRSRSESYLRRNSVTDFWKQLSETLHQNQGPKSPEDHAMQGATDSLFAGRGQTPYRKIFINVEQWLVFVTSDFCGERQYKSWAPFVFNVEFS